MPGGMKRMVIGTLERAVSTDINRLQAFANRDLAEVFRHLFDASQDMDVEASAVETLGISTGTPLRATIFGGLLPRPVNGTVDISIDAGAMCCVNPDAVVSADDSPLKIITDPGLSTGTLALTANGSGSIRIDVIECSRNPDSLIASDSRDIYNPATGLFTATTIAKERADRLTYRIRQGTPGAGYPAAVSGWVPLAVCSVANGATTWHQVTLWDVRPLASDRVAQPFASMRTVPKLGRQLLYSDSFTSGSEVRLSGYVEAEFDGYRIGGKIESGIPGNRLGWIEIKGVTHQASGTMLVANRPWYLYLVFPYGLPRWARYTDAIVGARAPSNPKGIPLISSVQPNAHGIATGNVNVPTATGLGGGSYTSRSLCVASGTCDSGGDVLGIMAEDRFTHFIAPSGLGNTSQADSADTTAAVWTLESGIDFPENARAIYVHIQGNFTSGASGTYYVESYVQMTEETGAHYLSGSFSSASLPAGAQQYAYAVGVETKTFDMTCRIPLPATMWPAQTTRTFKVRWRHVTSFSSAGAASTFLIRPLGWELGP